MNSHPVASDPRWHLLPPSPAARAWLPGLCVLLPLLIPLIALSVALAGPGPKKLLADSVPATWTFGLGLVLITTVPLWKWLDRAMQRQHLGLQDGLVEVRTSFYRERIGIAELQLEQARIIDLDEHRGYKPLLKTNGFALPGFHSGWFRLRNRQKAFVAGVGERRALWLPTTRGHGLWLQVRQPQVLLDTLKDMAPRAGGR